ncbi:hypothetical protein ASPZODRAFT_127972 [Penicilliopsis zonata CBS 506.65]|uniref:Sedlin n=1 Tax=Penicilliopsis zonata CBS 506.65 TaxID=1073090 RepID=A0A1L9SQJ8_9EURO|nr:hypothetical protein ASPZODRAFT_127972 [Penicilliopsis zonata CBS 506.65]OJJ49502.1 hypothetical protein ASPZODRAFT_127972 [Penicilliopsis zonata CBS 506.65]
MGCPKIACIALIGKADNPLHISMFTPYSDSELDFSFLLNSCLDLLEVRQKQTSIDQDLGLLHAVDERFAAYGWQTTTGVKFLIIVDVVGESMSAEMERVKDISVVGLGDSDLKPVFRAIQTAYIQLLQNPFYCPDGQALGAKATISNPGGLQITNQKFVSEIQRIGNLWVPGLASI